jgi:hypothetical protein
MGEEAAANKSGEELLNRGDEAAKEAEAAWSWPGERRKGEAVRRRGAW